MIEYILILSIGAGIFFTWYAFSSGDIFKLKAQYDLIKEIKEVDKIH